MKRTALFILLAVVFLFHQQAKAQSAGKYDSLLAKKLGADDYGMKTYILVMLKTGTADVKDKKVRDSLFRGHMANINRLADEQKLVVAGPIEENENHYEGIFVFNTPKREEAQQWLSTDPAFRAKLLDGDLYEWYCSAALMEISSLHAKIQKKNF